MIGVGKLVADEVLGEKSSLLEPLDSPDTKKVNYILPLIVHFLGVNLCCIDYFGGKMTDLENFVNQPGRDKLVKDVRNKIKDLG